MSIFDELGTEKALSLYKRMTLIRRFEEHVYFLFLQGEIPLGKAVVKRNGKDVTIVATHLSLYRSLAAADECHYYLESPIKRIATLDTPLPFAPIMEQAVVPSIERIRSVILGLLE